MDCRSPDRGGGDWWGLAGICGYFSATVAMCRDPAGICGDLSGPAGISGDLWGSAEICLASHSETF